MGAGPSRSAVLPGCLLEYEAEGLAVTLCDIERTIFATAAICPHAASVANAVEDAVGIRLTSLPFMLERVLYGAGRA